jgi:hypothetical protein
MPMVQWLKVRAWPEHTEIRNVVVDVLELIAMRRE